MSGWVPAFLLGMASAVVLETGLGLLLFVSPGLLPALTGLLSVALGSYALGLASVREPSGGQGGSRWPWFLAALSLIVAAFLSLGWSFQGTGVPETAWGRGTQMALLLALPLYGIGACLGTVARRRSGGRVGAAVAAGGAVGVTTLGILLLPRFEPFSVYLFCVLCVALAALGLAGSERRRIGDFPLKALGERDPWSLETLEP
jgi:hypothetical protein